MKKLNQEHLQALSYGLWILTTQQVWFVGYTELHSLITEQVKIKIDKKIAAGVMPKNGVMINLTPAEFTCLLDVNRYQLLDKNIEFRNGLFRILEYHRKKL